MATKNIFGSFRKCVKRNNHTWQYQEHTKYRADLEGKYTMSKDDLVNIYDESRYIGTFKVSEYITLTSKGHFLKI